MRHPGAGRSGTSALGTADEHGVALVGDKGAGGEVAHDAVQPQPRYQSGDAVTNDREALAVELQPDLPCATDADDDGLAWTISIAPTVKSLLALNLVPQPN